MILASSSTLSSVKHLLLLFQSNQEINKNNQLIQASACWEDVVVVESISMGRSTHISKRDSASRLTVSL